MLGLIILTGIILRLKLLILFPSLWIDECSIIRNINASDYLDLFKPLKYFVMSSQNLKD